MEYMDLVPIGEAAALVGLKASALRYYDERGLVPARARQRGTRVYGHDELRRLAFIRIAQRLGIPLEVAAEIFDAPSERWRDTVRDQIGVLDDLIEQAHGAKSFLAHALNCRHSHPTRDCPDMTAALDQLISGATTMDQLREQYS
jgi:DNA-binding transcriptional MerR regulator